MAWAFFVFVANRITLYFGSWMEKIIPGLRFLKGFIGSLGSKEPEYTLEYAPEVETESRMPVIPESAPNYQDPNDLPRTPYGNLDVDKLFNGPGGYSDIPESMLVRDPQGRAALAPQYKKPTSLPSQPPTEFFAP